MVSVIIPVPSLDTKNPFSIGDNEMHTTLVLLLASVLKSDCVNQFKTIYICMTNTHEKIS